MNVDRAGITNPSFTSSKISVSEKCMTVKLFLFYILVIRQNGSLPVKYGLTMDMEAKYSDIKPFLSRLTKIPVENLILVDIVQAQFR